MAFAIALLRWPDIGQPMKYVKGFELLGSIDESHVFREVLGTQVGSIDEDFFGEPAIAAVDELMQSTPPKDADLIFEKTADEVKKGYCSELLTLTEVNKRFGVGRWRPLHRFVAHQADGKKRLIDDGRRGHQNDWASLHETIYTLSQCS